VATSAVIPKIPRTKPSGAVSLGGGAQTPREGGGVVLGCGYGIDARFQARTIFSDFLFLFRQSLWNKIFFKILSELGRAIMFSEGICMPVVLTVEDDEQVRVLAESILKEEGYETLSANGVNEALALLRSDQKIDILFTDIQLGTDLQGGLDLAQEAVRLRPKIPVVYSSGRDLTDGMQTLFVEHSLYLHKPYDPAQLIDAVGTLANSFR
jgi:CheY-like chemotaxis protein